MVKQVVLPEKKEEDEEKKKKPGWPFSKGNLNFGPPWYPPLPNPPPVDGNVGLPPPHNPLGVGPVPGGRAGGIGAVRGAAEGAGTEDRRLPAKTRTRANELRRTEERESEEEALEELRNELEKRCPLVGNLTEDEKSPEPKGPTQSQSSGPEVDGNDRRSPEPKEPMQAWSSGPEVDGHCRRRTLLGPHNHEDNLFLSRAEMVANLTSKEKDCWVCGMGPVKVGAGLPLLGVPIGVNFTIALAGKIHFNTMTSNVKENGQAYKEPFKIWVDKHSTTLKGAPNGTYWLCGKMAYYSLPSNWGGTCTVGFLVTAMRTVPDNEKDLKALFIDYKLPGMRRDKRSLADVTHTQAPASRFFGVFFSGLACALDQMPDISRHIETFVNATRNALEQLNGELK
ncbi:unnamed protein product [Coregonus sp. 'balchen']|nr:unnamed protein product [Coregonus sp. 'balchen']